MYKTIIFFIIIVIVSIFILVRGGGTTEEANQNSQEVPLTNSNETKLSVLNQTIEQFKKENPNTTKTATIELEKGGTFKLALLPEIATKTVANFEKKANEGFYNGLTFHRVEDWVVQGGDPLGNGTGGGDMETELNQRSFIPGALGVARGMDIKISNDSQFFINTIAAPHLDGQYTNFGQLIEGAEVVLGLQIEDKIKSIKVN